MNSPYVAAAAAWAASEDADPRWSIQPNHAGLRAAVDAAIAAERHRLIGTDDEPGVLGRYEVNAIPAVKAGQKPVVTYYCNRIHRGTEGRPGHVGLIVRDMDSDQTGLTLGELAESALEHEAEHHAGDIAMPETGAACCALPVNHEGICEWTCSYCAGTGACGCCGGTSDDGSGLDDTCMECMSGRCVYCGGDGRVSR